MALLFGPKRDLEIAAECLDRMKKLENFQEFYRHWQDFLFRIEKAWESAQRDLQRMPGFQQWFGFYAEQERKDPLLIYLAHARDAETHSIWQTVDRPFRVLIREKYGYPFRLKSIKSTLGEDGVLSIDLQTSAEDSLLSYEASIVPTSPALQKFKNRGNWYNLPRTHLERSLPSTHPVDVAALGLAFYRAFIAEASYKFGGSRSRTPSRLKS
jgi:hypothetical protein